MKAFLSWKFLKILFLHPLRSWKQAVFGSQFGSQNWLRKAPCIVVGFRHHFSCISPKSSLFYMFLAFRICIDIIFLLKTKLIKWKAPKSVREPKIGILGLFGQKMVWLLIFNCNLSMFSVRIRERLINGALWLLTRAFRICNEIDFLPKNKRFRCHKATRHHFRVDGGSIFFYFFLSEHILWTKGHLWVPQAWSSVNPLVHKKTVPHQILFTLHSTWQ